MQKIKTVKGQKEALSGRTWDKSQSVRKGEHETKERDWQT